MGKKNSFFHRFIKITQNNFKFDKYDKDQNGLIDGFEFEEQLKQIRDKLFDNYEHFRKKFNWCDADKDKNLNKEEFHVFQFPREYKEYKVCMSLTLLDILKL